MPRRPMVLIEGGLDHVDNRRVRRALVLPEAQATVGRVPCTALRIYSIEPFRWSRNRNLGRLPRAPVGTLA